MTNDGSERSSPERLLRGGTDFERWLVRSARLDLAPETGIARTRRAVSLLGHRASGRAKVWAAALAAVVGLATATGVHWYWQPEEPPLSPESRQQAEVAARGPAPPTAARASSDGAALVISGCVSTVRAEGNTPLIDDGEDANARSLTLEGRAGTWLGTGDGSAPQKPQNGAHAFPELIPSGRDGSRYALHASGGKLTEHGGGLLLPFFEGALAGRCYDASRYRGLQFWAKGNTRIYVGLDMLDLLPHEFGGFCASDCYDFHKQPVELEHGWKHYRFEWRDFEQAGWGKRSSFEPSRLFQVEFSVTSPDTPYDFWIDDVSFVPSSP